jgi:guanylate kinase
MRELVNEPGFRQSPNITTRAPRDSDLPKEYTYLDPREYARLLAQPGRLLWDVAAGNGARYSKDICDVIEALTDDDNIYVQALVPSKAQELVRRYGSEHVKTVLLSTEDDVLLQRMAQRGDTAEGAQERLNNERLEGWLAQSLAIDGLYVVREETIARRHEEILDFATS